METNGTWKKTLIKWPIAYSNKNTSRSILVQFVKKVLLLIKINSCVW